MKPITLSRRTLLAGACQASTPSDRRRPARMILYGPQLPNPPPPVQRQHMEGYEGKLSDGEIAALASYVRSAWGNRGGSVSADQAAAQR